KEKGINAIAIYSGMHFSEIDIALDNCIYGNTKFLYMSPERLSTEIVRERIKKMKVNLLAVDEAHCISQWGYDFRPSYLKIAEIKEFLPDVPLLALTATATSEVVGDIQKKLQFKNDNVLRKSFERKNLAYRVLFEEDKLKRILLISEKLEGSGIIYVRSRMRTKQISDFLVKNKISADYYHAGVDPLLRDEKQNNWFKGKTRIIVCTNAFGMGIDKNNVRFVIHFDVPDCLEAYFQEAGRAGRDDKIAYAVLLYNDSDILDLRRNFTESFPEIEQIKITYQAIANYFQLAVNAGKGASFNFDMNDFCNTYNLKPINVYNCLKFIEKEGYLVVADSINMPSRIHIATDKESLYRFQVENPKFDNFIKLLLRSYSGIFNDFVKINESELAKRTNSTNEIIIESIKKLEKFEILKYLPKTNLPQLIFTEPRIDAKDLTISKENLEFRKREAEKRMNAMIHYVSSSNKCRSQYLLSYFNEADSYRCGMCDVCEKRNKLELSQIEFDNVVEQIKPGLKLESLSIEEIVAKVKGAKEDKVIKVIQWLLDNGKVYYDEENKLKWK
ncbi:MAG: RecQ family ATP-dependent DNA helicase, partial [Bacteroidales bacterium]|nr:RecQ family ATP-dependent DNA helicase [Bacteroidales bacterium]